MNVLVAFECSGIVRQAFRKRGHNAFSCDLKPAEDNDHNHIICDAAHAIMHGEWDLIIAHPPCTALCVSGNRYYAAGTEGFQKRLEAIQYTGTLWAMACKYANHVCFENPIGVLPTQSIMGKPSQIIHPWQFGHGETKSTCLWLKGLPLLTPTNIVHGREQKVWRMPPSPERATNRSRTYTGIAKAMAEQWENIL